MFIFLNDVVFKRGKDKKKRKKRNSIVKGVLGGTIGTAIGAATTPSERNIWGNREYNKTLKYYKNLKSKFPNEENTKAINSIKKSKKNFIKDYAEDYDAIKNGTWVTIQNRNFKGEKSRRIVDKVKKIRNNKMLKRSIIGLTVGSGVNYLYNRLKDKNE